MAKEIKENSDAAVAERLKELRAALGFEQSAEFADHLRIKKQRWNAFENGAPLSKEIAFLLKDTTGASLDWLYYGQPLGMPLELLIRLYGPRGDSDQQDLERLEDAVRAIIAGRAPRLVTYQVTVEARPFKHREPGKAG